MVGGSLSWPTGEQDSLGLRVSMVPVLFADTFWDPGTYDLLGDGLNSLHMG